MRKRKKAPSTGIPLSSDKEGLDPSKTFIGEGVWVEGILRSNQDLVIEGSVKGRLLLDGHHLLVGRSGYVEAEVKADCLTLSGRLKGTIRAQDRVEVTDHAEFIGEIRAHRISVEEGAYLKARVEAAPRSTKDQERPGNWMGSPSFDSNKACLGAAEKGRKGE